MTQEPESHDTPDPKHITGQVFVRDVGPVTLNGRRLVQIAGVIALEQGTLDSEHQYVVLGRVEEESGIVRLSIIPQTAANDRTDLARDASIDELLAMPIWIT
jgi:hypothetical protein